MMFPELTTKVWGGFVLYALFHFLFDGTYHQMRQQQELLAVWSNTSSPGYPLRAGRPMGDLQCTNTLVCRSVSFKGPQWIRAIVGRHSTDIVKGLQAAARDSNSRDWGVPVNRQAPQTVPATPPLPTQTSPGLLWSDEWGMTPLHWAALLGQTNVVYHLVRLGANINALDAHGRTPLVHSIFKKRVDTTDLLYNLNARECAHDARWDAQLFFQTGFPEFGRCALSRMNHTE